MIPLPANVRVWLATGHTDMRKGFSSLGLIVQETLRRDPHSGHRSWVNRGRMRPFTSRSEEAHYSSVASIEVPVVHDARIIVR